MVATVQRPQRRQQRTSTPSSTDASTDRPRLTHMSAMSAKIRPSHQSFRWIAILVVCILLWFVGAEWQTVVMVAGAASMFAMAIDQIESTSRR